MTRTALTGAERARRHIEKLRAVGAEAESLREEVRALRLEKDRLVAELAELQTQLEAALTEHGNERLGSARLHNEVEYLTGRVATLTDTVALLKLKPRRASGGRAAKKVRAPR